MKLGTMRGAVAAALVTAIAGCGGGESDATERAASDNVVVVSPENVTVVAMEQIETGPRVAGTLSADREAQIRAEVGGSIIQVFADPGQPVRAGHVLARIEDTSIREQFLSARSAARSAEQAAQLAQRNADRAQRLLAAGAISERDLETARVNASTAHAQLADAAARVALAQKQLANTQVRAPFAGVVGQRPVSAGDVVSPGTLLFTVVDPSRMKLDATVPANQMGAVAPGAPVEFMVQGYPGRVFRGSVLRVNPAADPATRQVGVTASVANEGNSLVSGLFAEGRIGSQVRMTLVAPMAAVDMNASAPAVMRINNGKVERVEVKLGMRDDQTERIEITAGVAAGDMLLLGAAQGISVGTPVRVQALDQSATR